MQSTRFAEVLGDAAMTARVILDINPRARRVSLRVDPGNSCIVLVRPPRMSDRAVGAFLESHAGWIATHLAKLPQRVNFSDGSVIPFAGAEHIIRLRPEARGGVWREGEEIIVTGKAEHTARRLRDWLKAEARKSLSTAVHAMAAQLDVKVTRISVRDTRSRWGSCTPDGKLSFSWRLIFAPADVLAYVAAHEVAHLKHMHHQPAFWRTVDVVLKEYAPGVDWKSAREWLRRRGTALHSYG